jgi:hypothetical protein
MRAIVVYESLWRNTAAIASGRTPPPRDWGAELVRG